MAVDLPLLYDYKPPSGMPPEEYWDTYGLGVLTDCISCEVREERNGAFEVELVYNSKGILAEEIKMGRIIRVPVTERDTHIFQANKVQPFRIYNIAKNLDGETVIRAEHITYALNGMYIHEYLANPIVDNTNDKVTPRTVNAMKFLEEILVKTYKPYGENYSSMAPYEIRLHDNIPNYNVIATWDIKGRSLMSALIDGAESFIGAVGGEIVRDIFALRIYESISSQTPAEWYRIDYGSNLKSIDLRYSLDNVATHLLPHATLSIPENIDSIYQMENGGARPYLRDEWSFKDSEFFHSNYPIVLNDTDGKPMHEKYGFFNVVPVDVSKQKDYLEKLWIGKGFMGGDNPRFIRHDRVINAMNKEARNFANFNKPHMVSMECTVDFISLWNTEEYKNLVGLDSLRLGDYARVYHPELPYPVETKVVGTTYDVLRKRFTKLELSSNFPGNDNKIRIPEIH